MKTISLAALGSYLPETIIENSFFDIDSSSSASMFKGTRLRRHVAPGESGASMIHKAALDLQARIGEAAVREVDILLTNVSIPDQFFTGCGASVVHKLGCRPKRIIDMHNAGCVAFIAMLEVARDLINSGAGKTALLCCAQNAGGRMYSQPGNRSRAQSAIPGDGCGVGYVVANDSSPIRSITTQVYGDFADDMQATNDDGTAWYEPHQSCHYLDFAEHRIGKIVARGNRLVPDAVKEACKLAEIAPQDISFLSTNQPSPIFLRNWREALQLPREKQLESFETFGNMFGAAIQVNLAAAVRDKRIGQNQYVALGGFAHAGDYAAAAIWQPGNVL